MNNSLIKNKEGEMRKLFAVLIKERESVVAGKGVAHLKYQIVK